MGLGLFASCSLSTVPGWAQTNLEAFDASGLATPLAPSDFSGLERTQPLNAKSFAVGLRSTYLKDLATFVVPSPGPDGTASAAIEGTLLHELTGALGVGAGFDVGVGLALHAPVWGAGDTATRGGAPFSSASFGDLRVGAGWSYAAGAGAVRPWATVYLPTGSTAALTGEGAVRADFGVSGSWDFEWLVTEVELGVRLRPTRELGVTRTGSGLRLGAGALARLTKDLLVGAEFFFLPTWVGSDAPPGETEAALWFPSEARLSGRFAFDSTWSVGAHAGAGLPTSRTSGLAQDPSPTRGVSSPSFRAGLEARASF